MASLMLPAERQASLGADPHNPNRDSRAEHWSGFILMRVCFSCHNVSYEPRKLKATFERSLR